MKNDKCRFCDSELDELILDLGEMPLANSFLEEMELDKEEFTLPLQMYICKNCFLVQLKQFEIPEKIFLDYAYFSSYSSSWLEHAKNYADRITKQLELNKNSFVLEIASNDGYLLQYFKNKEIPVLGIEPAENIAKVANEKGINTLNEFFSLTLAKKLSISEKSADLIIGNNVFAHVPEINNFVEGLRVMLNDNGVITLEFPHLLQLIEKNQFDTIYHEHLSYFSLNTVKTILSSHDLEIFDVEELSTHGGSLRIFVKHKKNSKIKISINVEHILEKEKENGLLEISFYKKFSDNVKKIRTDFSEFLNEVKNKNAKIVCYGAPAKGNTFLNYCKIDSRMISFTVDKNPHKQGKFLPGTHISIKDPSELMNEKPDYVIILPWNLENEIKNEISFVRDWNGKFVIVIPEVRIS
jgi:2-polyprenyl-3-methyl-5-hydroxy-6-metoxy-1,4-benzoquinol methylase